MGYLLNRTIPNMRVPHIMRTLDGLSNVQRIPSTLDLDVLHTRLRQLLPIAKPKVVVRIMCVDAVHAVVLCVFQQPVVLLG